MWVESTETDFNDGVYNLTMTSGTGTGAQLILSPFGTGADGSVTISATKNINTDIITGGRSYADGINYAVSGVWISSITCSVAPNGIITGDEIIIINQQGDLTNYGNAGNYEFFRIASVSGNFLIFTSSITKIYGATTSNNVLTGQKIVTQRVPNWGDVSISGAAVSLICTAWDGTKGGMVVFRATATVAVGSGASIDVNTKGFRGGVSGSNGPEDARNTNIITSGTDGTVGQNPGTSIYGTPGSAGGLGPSGGGTGGNGGSVPSGGGGTGTGGTGNRGGGSGAGHYHGTGGGGGGCYSSGGNYSGATYLMLGGGAAAGGGGGAGLGGNGGKCNGEGGKNGATVEGGNGSSGNPGAGIIFISAKILSGSGNLLAVGGLGGSGGGGASGDGSRATHKCSGGGGGGGANGAAGGTVYLVYDSSSWSGSTNISGGSGGGGGGGAGVPNQHNPSSSSGGGGGAGTGGGGGAGTVDLSVGSKGGNAGFAGAGGGSSGGAANGGGGGTNGNGGAGGAANTGGTGSGGTGNKGLDASGLNGGAGGPGSESYGTDVNYAAGGGGGGSGATGASGYVSTVAGNYYTALGTYKSGVLDSGAKVVVSSVGWTPSSQPAGSNVNVGLRVSSASFSVGSATPDWVSVTNGQTVNLAGRYVQYMSTFTTTSSTTTPRIEDITINYKVKPWQEKTVTRTGPNAFGFGGGESWEWEVPAKSGQLVTITAYVRYNTSYGTASKPKLTLYNLGISNTATMAQGADTWEQLTVSGTPNRNGILKLKIEGFSTVPEAKMFVDDINISQ